MAEWLRFAIAAVLILSGLFVLISAVFGVYRFRYVLNRMHAAAMGDTLGISMVLLGLIVSGGFTATSLKLLVIVAMLWLTSPVASHLITRLEVTTNEKLGEEMEDLRK